MLCPNGKAFFGTILAVVLPVLVASTAHAEDDRQAIHNIVLLDQAAHIMSMEFDGAPRQADASADRHVVDAEGLLATGHTDEAATMLLSVMREWPRTRAAQDATFLLAEALFRLGDFLSARSFYEEAVAGFTGTRREQRAVSRLIELALRTGDYQPVDGYLRLLARVPAVALDPCVPYVRAKLSYQRGELDRALELFAAIPLTSPFAWQARYFIGTIQVKTHQLNAAATAFAGLLDTRPPEDDAAARDIQELARLAVARICLEQERLPCARDHYAAIPPKSKFIAAALYELGFTYVRSKQFELAQETFERLLRNDPDGEQAFEVRILVGNLWLRRGDLTSAHRMFAGTSGELTPSYDKLREVVAAPAGQPPPGEADFPAGLAALGVEGIARGAFGTDAGRNWARADPQVARLLTLAKDIADAPRQLAESKGTLHAIELALANPDSQMLFPDLTRARSALTRVSTELLAIRGRFAQRARDSEAKYLLAVEAQRLDGNRGQLAEIERQLTARLSRRPPDTVQHLQPVDDRYAAPALPPGSRRETTGPQELVAWYPLQQAGYSSSPSEGPVSTPTRAAGRAAAAPTHLRALLQQEQQLHQAVRARMVVSERQELDRELEVLSRADAVLFQLVDLDARIDDEIDRRLNKAKDFVSARRLEIAAAEKSAEGVTTAAGEVDAEAMRALRAHLTNRLAGLVVLADVGLIDVAWARKSRVTTKIMAQQADKNRELAVIRASMDRDEQALNQHFAAVTEWARLAGVPIVDRRGD